MLTPVEGESSSSALNCWHLKTKGECSVTEFWLPRQNESPKLVLRLGFLFTQGTAPATAFLPLHSGSATNLLPT